MIHKSWIVLRKLSVLIDLLPDRILVTANVADFEHLARSNELHCGIVVVLDGSLRRTQQLDVLGKIVDTLAAEYAAGRDMVNRVLRVSLDGANEFFELPTSRQ